jgi:hypothetical protein
LGVQFHAEFPAHVVESRILEPWIRENPEKNAAWGEKCRNDLRETGKKFAWLIGGKKIGRFGACLIFWTLL